MIKLIVGNKGSGKTKLLLEAVSQGVASTDGNVVFVDNSDQHSFQIDHSVRLINALNYNIDSHERFIGLVAGILAGNYDITDIYIDAILRIVGRDYDKLGAMLEEIDKISGNVTVMFTISADMSDLPESVAKFA